MSALNAVVRRYATGKRLDTADGNLATGWQALADWLGEDATHGELWPLISKEVISDRCIDEG